MEKWDAYDVHLNRIDNLTLIRGEVVPDGVFHLVGGVIVKHTDGTYLLMKRDKRKYLGGMWEATAYGAALQGEKPLTCAIRELKEETGIVSDDLIEIGRVLHHGRKTYYVYYLCTTNIDKDNIILQKGETSAYKWVTCDELRRMSRDEIVTQMIQNFIEELL